jgi:c-di-GMP-binding flagellar brake protein YcgR
MEGQDRLVQDVVGGQTQIDLYIPSMSILMRCRLKQTDAPYRYYLELPEFIAQVERRQFLRLNVYEQEEIKVSFGKTVTLPRAMSQFFLKSCFDVSAGGISFFVSKSEAKLFSPEDLIPSMELKANGLSAKISSQVLSIREVEPDENNGFSYKVWRVSCKITQIDALSKKQLERFIFERIKDELHAING